MKTPLIRLIGIPAAPVLLLLLAACGGDAGINLVGEWDIEVAQGAAVDPSVKFQVEILEDGTYVVTGNRVFEMMAGIEKAKGTWSMRGENVVRTTMEPNGLDYPTTDLSIQEVTRSELILSADDFVLTLKRK